VGRRASGRDAASTGDAGASGNRADSGRSEIFAWINAAGRHQRIGSAVPGGVSASHESRTGGAQVEPRAVSASDFRAAQNITESAPQFSGTGKAARKPH